LAESLLLQDLLGLVHLAGAARNRRITAADVLTDLALAYRQAACTLVKSDYFRLRQLKLLEFIEAVKDPTVRNETVNYLVANSTLTNLSSHLVNSVRIHGENNSIVPSVGALCVSV